MARAGEVGRGEAAEAPAVVGDQNRSVVLVGESLQVHGHVIDEQQGADLAIPFESHVGADAR